MDVQYSKETCEDIELGCDKECLDSLVEDGAIVTLQNSYAEDKMEFADTIFVDLSDLDKDSVSWCLHLMLIGLNSADEIDEVAEDVYRFWWD